MKKLLTVALCAALFVMSSQAAFAGVKSNILDSMKTAREKLVALLDTADKGTQTVLIDEIKAATAEADGKIEAALADAATPADAKTAITEANGVWGEFKKTRDEEIVPFVQAGKVDEAKALAKGVQLERFKKIVGLLNEE